MPEILNLDLNDVRIEPGGDPDSVVVVFNVRPEPVKLLFSNKDSAAEVLRCLAAKVKN